MHTGPGCRIISTIGGIGLGYPNFFRQWIMYFNVGGNRSHQLTFKHYGDARDPVFTSISLNEASGSILRIEIDEDFTPQCKNGGDAPWFKYNLLFQLTGRNIKYFNWFN